MYCTAGPSQAGGEGALAPPVFGQTVNPISTRGTDYTHHSTTSPPRISDLATGLPPKIVLTYFFRRHLTWTSMMNCFALHFCELFWYRSCVHKSENQIIHEDIASNKKHRWIWCFLVYRNKNTECRSWTAELFCLFQLSSSWKSECLQTAFFSSGFNTSA